MQTKRTWLTIPKGLEQFEFTRAGIYRINVIPFVAGKNNPLADEGRIHYEQTYWVHDLGERRYCCLWKNWGKACPMCEWVVRKFVKRSRYKEAYPFQPKERQLWLFDDVTAMHGRGPARRTRKPALKLFDAAYLGGYFANSTHKGFGGIPFKGGIICAGFGQLIDNKKFLPLPKLDDRVPARTFHRLDAGMTLKVKTWKRGDTYTVDNIDFVSRREKYSTDLANEVPCLDLMPKEPEYEKLRAIMRTTTAA
jgi:hypothetical protein